jgi:exodeoxyribonuclease-5
MELTDGQKMALQAIEAVGKSHPRGGGLVIINGFAGVGKSTMLKALVEEDDGLLVLAPTGKAALRVKEVTGARAQTIHRWIYQPEEDDRTGDVRFVKKEIGEVTIPRNGTVFVDEASMVTYGAFRDLYSFAKSLELNLVFIGDGFQLPPVEMKEERKGFSLFNDSTPAHYKVQMTEVLRQAQDSPIIRASMACRDPKTRLEFLGTDIPTMQAADMEVVASAAAEVSMRQGFVICHRNVTRHQINAGVRSHLKLSPDTIQEEEPLLVLQNNYTADVYNGEILTVDTVPERLNRLPYPVRDRHSNESMNMNFYLFESNTLQGLQPLIVADKEVFGLHGKIGFKAIRRAGQDLSLSKKAQASDLEVPDPVISANFGYCLTAHKSQGSETNDVLVCIESSVRLSTEEGRRWLYVALTRAKQNVKVCWL